MATKMWGLFLFSLIVNTTNQAIETPEHAKIRNHHKILRARINVWFAPYSNPNHKAIRENNQSIYLSHAYYQSY